MSPEWGLVLVTVVLCHATYHMIPADQRPSVGHMITHLVRVTVTIRDHGRVVIIRAWGFCLHHGRWARWQYSALRYRAPRYVGAHRPAGRIPAGEGATDHESHQDRAPASSTASR